MTPRDVSLAALFVAALTLPNCTPGSHATSSPEGQREATAEMRSSTDVHPSPEAAPQTQPQRIDEEHAPARLHPAAGQGAQNGADAHGDGVAGGTSDQGDDTQSEGEAHEPASGDGLFPPGGAQLLALLHEAELADEACHLSERRGTWNERLQGAAWTPGLFPGDAVREDAEVVTSGSRRYALTFDDGPDRELTPALLDLLEQLDVRATFFILGSRINSRTYPLIQRMVAEGHTLGNHSFRHDTNETLHRTEAWGASYLRAEYRLTQIRVDMALAAQSPAAFRRLDRAIFGDIDYRTPPEEVAARWPALEAAYRRELGEVADDPLRAGRMFYARPPGGNPWFGAMERAPFRVIAASAMQDLGYAIVLWDIDSRDWWYVAHEDDETARLKGIAEEVLNARAKEGILLFHDRVPLDALRALTALLRGQELHVAPDATSVGPDKPEDESIGEAPPSPGARFVTLEELSREVWGCEREALAELLSDGGLERALEDARRLAEEGTLIPTDAAP